MDAMTTYVLKDTILGRALLRFHMLSWIIRIQFNFTTKIYRQDH